MFDDDVFPFQTTTPIERLPEDPWYMRLLSEWCDAWENVRDLWRTRDCWSKLYAIVSFVCLPLRAIRRASSHHNNITIPDHASMCYLFLLMCYTFVLNLIELGESNKRRDTFVASCMALAIPAMLYVCLFTKDRVRHDPCHNAPMRIFFRGGLYILGFASIMNSVCLAIDEWSCQPSKNEFDNKTAATVQFVKALFVVTETLFLGYFHKACFPVDTAFLQISLAHILGTNLALWFWTLCEEAKPRHTECKTAPKLGWDRYQKYFYPVFIEYLFLGLAILYQLWINLRHGEEMLCRFCKNCKRCLYCSQTPIPEEENNDQIASLRQRSSTNLQRIRSIDYDDALLYISLMGILLIEGFHAVSKIIAGRSYFYLLALDISGTVQHLTQAVTLMSLSRTTSGPRNRAWICECILFLLLTNLAWWVQNSFYLEPIH
ncbi:Hypothetical predicted protein [Paramuricea clavata]|uniref:Uncharacterized protein n=1 Tax=Paramuricea clavata TaxID=317549 RepID=A0A7D9HK04_PARCT|nr:Hypothetical predicted protein [Paramuricea clavata]